LRRYFATAFLVLAPFFVIAQTAGDPSVDTISLDAVDDLFNGSHDEDDPGEDTAGPSLWPTIKLRGLAIDASFSFLGGYMPGWSDTPWNADDDTKFTNLVGAEMKAMLGLDFQFSEVLRVRSAFSYRIPDFAFVLDEFFFDYNLVNRAFFRVGKYHHYWGISPNFPFTNLLARVPAGSSGGDLYVARVDIPYRIGGFQLLAITRNGFWSAQNRLNAKEIAYGGKYNLAFRYADIDMGGLYFKDMPLRFFTSVKATIVNTEVYAEGLFATDLDEPYGPDLGGEKQNVFSWNTGFMQGFFKDRLTINGEVFYSGEKNVSYFQEESELKQAQTTPFIEGFNFALNFVYRFNWKRFRVFAQGLYSLKEESSQIVPGLSFSPFTDVTVTLGVPFVVGSRSSTYYKSNADRENRPFSIILGVRITGSYVLTRYEDD
jgi:hypothetical protein